MKNQIALIFSLISCGCFAQDLNSDKYLSVLDSLVRGSNIAISEICKGHILQDLINLDSNYESNHITTKEKDSLLIEFISMILIQANRELSWAPNEFEVNEYNRIKSGLFPQLITLSLKSVPDSVNVFIEGTAIVLGETPIDRRYHSNTTIVFIFRKSGYRELRKEWKVSEFPAFQEVKVELERL